MVTSYVVTSKKKKTTLDDSQVLATANDYRGLVTPSPKRESSEIVARKNLVVKRERED